MQRRGEGAQRYVLLRLALAAGRVQPDGRPRARPLGAREATLAAEDYCLILGMPGTGKTTTIARVIETLVARVKHRSCFGIVTS